jgi:hypothetical protein
MSAHAWPGDRSAFQYRHAMAGGAATVVAV